MSQHPAADRRTGFTLVEMLVVVVIVLFLATLAAALVPRLGQSQKVAKGADMLQGWLLVARQRAMRDGAPTGIRILPDPETQTFSATPVATPGSASMTLGAVSGLTSAGWTWNIQVGCPLIIEPNNFSSMEVVWVSNVVGNVVTAGPFNKPHATPNFAVRMLAFAKDMQYIQQPDDFNGAAVSSGLLQGGKITVTNTGGQWTVAPDQTSSPPVDFTGGYGLTDPTMTTWAVQPGDYLEVKGGGLVHLITAVSPGPPSTLTLASGPPNPITTPTNEYRIIRAPRPLSGEAVLSLPQDVGIDLQANYLPILGGGAAGPPLPIDASSAGQTAGNIDILFAPGGAVIGRGTPSDRVVLWVRDMTLNDPGPPPPQVQGEPTLMTINVRTGQIAAHPADMANPSGDYFGFTKDGRSSGL